MQEDCRPRTIDGIQSLGLQSKGKGGIRNARVRLEWEFPSKAADLQKPYNLIVAQG
jgi:hypothetical protein